MSFWSRPATEPQPAPPALDTEHVRVLRLLVTDTYRWKHDRALWRIRFTQDAHTPGLSPLQVAALVQNQAQPLCAAPAWADANILYLEDERDIGRVFERFGAITQGPGLISAIQNRDNYVAASRMAAHLVGRATRANAAGAQGVPDFQWSVTGHDQARVAQARVGAYHVVVRHSGVAGQDAWVVEVNGKANCAQFRSRADAMSKLGVGVAIETFLGRRA